MTRTSSDPVRALLGHARQVLLTRHHPREARVDLALPAALRRPLGCDLVERCEALIGVTLAALELIAARRTRDRLLALGRPDKAQPHGRQVAIAEQTIEDLIARVVATREQAEAARQAGHARHRGGKLKDRADHQAAELAPVYAQALQAGCATDNAVAAYLNAKGIPAPAMRGYSTSWTEGRAAALRRRLTRLGLASLALTISCEAAPPSRVVRTRTRPSATEPRQPRQEAGAAWS